MKYKEISGRVMHLVAYHQEASISDLVAIASSDLASRVVIPAHDASKVLNGIENETASTASSPSDSSKASLQKSSLPLPPIPFSAPAFAGFATSSETPPYTPSLEGFNPFFTQNKPIIASSSLEVGTAKLGVVKEVKYPWRQNTQDPLLPSPTLSTIGFEDLFLEKDEDIGCEKNPKPRKEKEIDESKKGEGNGNWIDDFF